jgi:lipopolysaccharide/colanic/teichoic acid biosynthesis glycosyltransferase
MGKKLNWDLKYIEKVSFIGDVKILFETVAAVFKRSGITDGEMQQHLIMGMRC